jgi:hypothetical protein
MPDLTFSPPLEVRFKQEKYLRFGRALRRMGFQGVKFFAVRITHDGKVHPDPSCLSSDRDSEGPIRGSLIEFDEVMAAQLLANQIKFD